MAEVFTGTVARWFGLKGYGFLTGEDGGDLFCHKSALTDCNALLDG